MKRKRKEQIDSKLNLWYTLNTKYQEHRPSPVKLATKLMDMIDMVYTGEEQDYAYKKMNEIIKKELYGA